MMKILHVITRINRGGTANWLRNLVDLDRESGTETIFAAGRPPSEEIEDEFFHGMGYLEIPHLNKSISFYQDLKAFFEIRKILICVQPEILNTHTSKAGLIGRLANASIRHSQTKVIHTFHGHLLYGYFSRFLTYFYTKLEILLEFITDVYIVSGERVKNELIAAGIGKRSQWVQINPGIPKLNIREKFESRKTLRLNSSDFTIGWMGRLEQIKRPNLLIDIAKLIPEVNFIVAGTGSLEKILRQSSPPNISYVGWISPEVFWSACDLAISTSENEAQPFALIEAGLAGLPLIAFDVGGIDGVVVEQRNGYLCDTILEISEKIILLKSDMPKRIRYGEFSKTHMSKNFNVETFRDKHRELFYQIERKKR